MSNHLAKPASVYRIEYPFQTYIIDQFVLSEVGRPMWVSRHYRFASLEIAERFATRTGGRYIGILQGEEIDFEGDFCDAVVRERDREWLEGRVAIDNRDES